MTRQGYIISALAALLLIVLATWGAREHLNTKTVDRLDTSMRQAATVASTQQLQLVSLKHQVTEQLVTIHAKDEQLRVAIHTHKHAETVTLPGGEKRTVVDTLTDSQADSDTRQLDLNEALRADLLDRSDRFELVARTATAELQLLKDEQHQAQLDQVRSAPKLALLLGYDLSLLGDPAGPDWVHRARLGLGWPIGLGMLGADLAPAYLAQGQWVESRPMLRGELLFR